MTKFLFYFLLFCALFCGIASKPQTDKIQDRINITKQLYSSEDENYVVGNDGYAFIKSYKRWIPSDLLILKKEDFGTLQFLKQAYEHHRLDVLNQLLPDYYRGRGGAQAFGDAIKRIIDEKNATAVTP